MTGALHITFSGSVAGTLRQALAAAGRGDERVLDFPDNLSRGPIDPPDPAARHAGLLGIDDPWWPPEYLEAFWDRLLGTTARRVFWYSRRWTQDWCGMMEMVRRLGDAPYDAVEFTRCQFAVLGHDDRTPPHRNLGFGEMNTQRLGAFLAHVQPVPGPERDAHRTLWTRLRAENAPLRVLEGDTIRSAPIDAFDAELLALAAPEWRKTAQVVGPCMARCFDAPHLQADDRFLAQRIRALVSQGRLEGRGDLSDIFASEVRLPPGA